MISAPSEGLLAPHPPILPEKLAMKTPSLSSILNFQVDKTRNGDYNQFMGGYIITRRNEYETVHFLCIDPFLHIPSS